MTTEAFLNVSQFEVLEDTSFTVVSTDPQLSLDLIEVKSLGGGMREGGAFSLLFQGPKDVMAPQATYRLSHSALGSEIDLFLVPVNEVDAGFQYEAIFT